MHAVYARYPCDGQRFRQHAGFGITAHAFSPGGLIAGVTAIASAQ